MSMGLDLGNTQWRSLRRENYRLIGRSCRSAYVSMSNRKSRRRLLEQLNVPYLILDDQLTVLGDTTDDIAELLRLPVTPLMPRERSMSIPPLTRHVIAEIADSLLPESRFPGEVCCFTAGMSRKLDYDIESQVASEIRRCGYRPLGIGSATAVVLAELGDQALTGVGVTFGSTRCEAALVRHGVELARGTVERGGDWIDEQLAVRQSRQIWDRDGSKRYDVAATREWKESNAGKLLSPESADERHLAALYRELVCGVVGAIRDAYDSAPDVFDALQPVTIVCAGGTASHPGFREIVLAALRKLPLPFGVKQVRAVRGWKYSVARGCLIRAALEDQAVGSRAA